MEQEHTDGTGREREEPGPTCCKGQNSAGMVTELLTVVLQLGRLVRFYPPEVQNKEYTPACQPARRHGRRMTSPSLAPWPGQETAMSMLDHGGGERKAFAYLLFGGGGHWLEAAILVAGWAIDDNPPNLPSICTYLLGLNATGRPASAFRKVPMTRNR